MQAAAVAAGFSNVVIVVTCRVGVRPLKKREIEVASAIAFTLRHHSSTGLQQVVFIRNLLCCWVLWSVVSICIKPVYEMGRSKRTNWTRAFDLNHILLKASQTFGSN